jgi:uncharacterized membrane protein
MERLPFELLSQLKGENMAKAFWLGIIGGIFGILAAVLVVMIGGIGEAFNATGASSLYTNAAGAFIFSIVGIAGGVLEKRKILAAALMFIGAVGVLISISLFGVLSLILFAVGGILILMQKKEQPAAALPTAGQNAG